ncbi:hypothetical protein V1283_008632 [Bradyrhizobium sp. AZCC 2262]
MQKRRYQRTFGALSAQEGRPPVDHSHGAGLSIAIKSSTSMRGRTTAY